MAAERLANGDNQPLDLSPWWPPKSWSFTWDPKSWSFTWETLFFLFSFFLDLFFSSVFRFSLRFFLEFLWMLKHLRMLKSSNSSLLAIPSGACFLATLPSSLVSLIFFCFPWLFCSLKGPSSAWKGEITLSNHLKTPTSEDVFGPLGVLSHWVLHRLAQGL